MLSQDETTAAFFCDGRLRSKGASPDARRFAFGAATTTRASPSAAAGRPPPRSAERAHGQGPDRGTRSKKPASSAGTASGRGEKTSTRTPCGRPGHDVIEIREGPPLRERGSGGPEPCERPGGARPHGWCREAPARRGAGDLELAELAAFVVALPDKGLVVLTELAEAGHDRLAQVVVGQLLLDVDPRLDGVARGEVVQPHVELGRQQLIEELRGRTGRALRPPAGR